MSVVAYIGIGANLGAPARAIRAAVERLARLPGTRVEAASSLYRSAPVGTSQPQPDYLNAVARVRTGLSASRLLAALHSIERDLGRVRGEHNAARTIDLDLLLYGDRRLRLPGLDVPHPRMHLRAFVLLPLLELAPDAVIPGVGPASALLPAVADQRIERLESPSEEAA
jgi:2-amino-4-hydroxy-6-hydroxymethyldihydropteridine diphosphokinase